MSEPKFTKGPWRVGPYGGVYPLGNGPMIASADTKSGYLPNHENNEILIAAAPDLYEALKEVETIVSMSVEDDAPSLKKLRSALAKAAGVK